MDDAKCRALKAELLSDPGSPLVAMARFLDGNDDLGSIGCNLDPHPGVEAFRPILAGVLGRPGVRAVYARVSEADPGEGCWPFADAVLVVGDMPLPELRRAVLALRPDEVGAAGAADLPPAVAAPPGTPVSVIWWD